MHVHLTEASYRETSVRMVYVFYVLGLFASQYRAAKQPIATSFYSLARVIFTARSLLYFEIQTAQTCSYQVPVLYIVSGTLTSCSVLKHSNSFQNARSNSPSD